MNELQIFENTEFGEIRVVEHEGQPWFVAKDILKALGYAEDYNPSRALQAVPEEWKGVQPIHPRRNAGNAYPFRVWPVLLPRSLR